jgi:hypothetical protein
VSETLQARQAHHRQQRTDVKARSGWIESDVRGQPLAVQCVRDAFGCILQETAPGEFVDQVRQNVYYIFDDDPSAA